VSGDHARLSPSAAHRWMKCPGSVNLSEGVDSPDTEHSLLGTFAHTVAAKALLEMIPAAKLVGHQEADKKHVVDAEMAKHLQLYLDAVNGTARMVGVTPKVEVKVFLSKGCNGTSDAIVYGEDTLDVFDLKYGAGHLVEATNNPQLEIYAIGALLRLSIEEIKKITSVTLHIVQPRRPDADGQVWRSSTMTTAELFERRKVIEAAGRATTLPDAPLVSGDHCTFCLVKNTCPRLREDGLAVARVAFSGGAVVGEPPEAELMTPEQLGAVLDKVDTLEAWISAVRAQAQKVSATTKVPGFKLVQRLSNRRWIDEVKAQSALEAAGIDPFAPREIISPAAAEKLLGKRKKIVETLAGRLPTGVALVRDSDKRPALNPAAVFGKLLDEVDDLFS